MRVLLFLGMMALLCLAINAEEPKAEPEAAAEPEPAAEPEHAHDHEAGSSKQETKAAAKNLAATPWALGVPTIIAISVMAKYVV